MLFHNQSAENDLDANNVNDHFIKQRLSIHQSQRLFMNQTVEEVVISAKNEKKQILLPDDVWNDCIVRSTE